MRYVLDLEKADGPYIGPKGGKWKDPEHKIPWEESATDGAKGYRTAVKRAIAQGSKPPSFTQFGVTGKEAVAIIKQVAKEGKKERKQKFTAEMKQIQAKTGETGKLQSKTRSLRHQIKQVRGETKKIDEAIAAQERTEESGKSFSAFVLDLIKALGGGPFIGPRGGKWANPQHTIPWEPAKPAKGKRIKFEPTKTRRNWIDHHPSMPKNTAEKYKQPDGTYEPKRQVLHNRIVDDFVRGKKPPPSNKQKLAIVMMGGPASGKTSLVKGIMKDRFNDFVNINPDDVKETLPEYKLGLEVSAKDTAIVLHDESSDVARRVYNEAIDNGLNVIVDGTGKASDKHIAKIKQLQKEGYHVTIMMPDIDTEEAVKRVADRAERTGRFVPDDVVRPAYQKIPANFELIVREADTFGLFDTRGRPPALKWGGGKGQKDRVHDPRFVAKFKSRAQRLKAKVKKALEGFFIVPDELKKADKKPPAFTIEELAESIKEADHGTLYPDEKLPKLYDRTTGIIWPVEDLDLLTNR